MQPLDRLRPAVAVVFTVVLGSCVPRVHAEITQLAETAEAPPLVAPPEQPNVPAVAVVNGVVITTDQFRAIYDLKLQKYADRGREIPPSADERYQRSITDRLIYQEVLRQEAKRRGINDDKDALAELEARARRGIGDWQAHLARRGESDESLRQLYLADLRERAMLEADGKLEVTQADVLAKYGQIESEYTDDKPRIHASHILIRVGPAEPDHEPTAAEKREWKAAATARAAAIHVHAIAPDADFAEIARDVSEGPSAGKGGDLGFFSADRMVDEFSRVAFALAVGEVSKPVETKFGIHIIKLHGKYPPGPLPLEALEPQIRADLASLRLREGRRDLKQMLLERYEIENHTQRQLGPAPPSPTLEELRAQLGHSSPEPDPDP